MKGWSPDRLRHVFGVLLVCLAVDLCKVYGRVQRRIGVILADNQHFFLALTFIRAHAARFEYWRSRDGHPTNAVLVAELDVINVSQLTVFDILEELSHVDVLEGSNSICEQKDNGLLEGLVVVDKLA